MNFQNYNWKHELYQIISKLQCYFFSQFIFQKTNSRADILCMNLTAIMNVAKHIISPVFSSTHSCTALLLLNLVQPEWISIDCTLPLSTGLICVINSSKSKPEAEIHNRNKSCSLFAFRVKNSCFLPFWVNGTGNMNFICSGGIAMSAAELEKLEIETLNIIANAIIPTNFSILVFPFSSTSNVSKLVVRRYLNLLTWEKQTANHDQVGGTVLCRLSPEDNTFYSNMFECKEGGHISQLFVCNSKLIVCMMTQMNQAVIAQKAAHSLQTLPFARQKGMIPVGTFSISPSLVNVTKCCQKKE